MAPSNSRNDLKLDLPSAEIPEDFQYLMEFDHGDDIYDQSTIHWRSAVLAVCNASCSSFHIPPPTMTSMGRIHSKLMYTHGQPVTNYCALYSGALYSTTYTVDIIIFPNSTSTKLFVLFVCVFHLGLEYALIDCIYILYCLVLIGLQSSFGQWQEFSL